MASRASRGGPVSRWLAAGLAAAAAAGLAGCAGPTPNDLTYREQAAQSAQAMTGLVQTAMLAAQAQLRGRSFGPFTDTTITDAETDAGSVQNTFESRQPPDGTADSIRSTIDQPLTDAVDGLQALRIAERRGDATAIRQALHQLAAAQAALFQAERRLSG